MALNVMVMGETGVGKSALVNLIAGHEIAKVSPDASLCTAKTTKYPTTVGLAPYILWEVTGFNQPGTNSDAQIMEKGLLSAVEQKATVDVVLFCMRGKKMTKETQTIYSLIKLMFGDYVPIILVVMHLEGEKVMEDWWVRNEQGLKNKGVVGEAHVCVTAVRDQARYATKSADSRRDVLGVLEASRSPNRGGKSMAFMFLQYLQRVDPDIAKGRKMEKVLQKRYKLDKAGAQRLATLL